MNKDLGRAHISTLSDWALTYERDGTSGTGEVAFLLRRAARQIGRVVGIDESQLPSEPVSPTRESGVDSAKPDEAA